MNAEEIKNKIKEIAAQDGYIDGIYNYCDRWCERCQFTSKCRNYAIGRECELDAEGINEKFWENMSNVFQATMLMIEEHMAELDIDMKELKEDTSIAEERDNAKNHPLHKLAHDTSFEIHNWLQANDESLKAKAETSFSISEEQSLKFIDALEVIQWYNFFISAKIYRALSNVGFDADDEMAHYDNNGSAKIALISIERSISAWGVLYESMPENEDHILKFLAAISKIMHLTEKQFPNARSFHRSGLDD